MICGGFQANQSDANGDYPEDAADVILRLTRFGIISEEKFKKCFYSSFSLEKTFRGKKKGYFFKDNEE